MKVRSIVKKLISLMLSMVLIITMMPISIFAEAIEGQDASEDPMPESVIPVIKDENGEIKEEDDWIATYPYGTFAFGDFQSDIGEEGAKTEEGKTIPSKIRIPVYRVGGTSGKVTAKITYAPAVTMLPDGSGYMYDYAASGKKDLIIRYEDPKTIAQYQEIGMPDPLRNMKAADTAVVFDEPGETPSPEDDVLLKLTLEQEADSYQWQAKSTLGWADVREASESSFLTAWKDIWDFENDCPGSIDYRCIYVLDGVYYCSQSLYGESYEEIPDVNEIPEDIPLEEEPSFSTLVFEEDFDIWEFDLTYADGETVKYIEIEAIDDDEVELPEMGIFTIVECEGGELSDLCNTHTVLVSDNDEHGTSIVGFKVKDYRIDRNSGTAYVKVIRAGDTSYNITVDYETEDMSAVAGVDYAHTSGTVALLGSIDEVEIPIELIANGETGNKSFKVKLSNIKGGGLDDLCEMGLDETIVTITGEADSDGETGQNLSTVLSGADGDDYTGRIKTENNALIGDTTVTNWNYDGASSDEQLYADFNMPAASTGGNSPQSFLAHEGLTFSRASLAADYTSGDYWCDRELLVGVNNKGIPSTENGGVNTMRYLSDMEVVVDEAHYVDGSIPDKVKTSASYVTSVVPGAYRVQNQSTYEFEDRQLEYYQISSNYSAKAEKWIEHGGLLFSSFHFSFKMENYGKKGTSSYYYPLIWFDYNDGRVTSRNYQTNLGDAGRLNVRSSSDYTVAWLLGLNNSKPGQDDWAYSYNIKDTGDEQKWFEGDAHNSGSNIYLRGSSASADYVWNIDFSDQDFGFGVDFINVDQYDTSYTERKKSEVADDATIVDVINLNFKRRAFADGMTLPVVIYTANDENEVQSGWSPIDVSTVYGAALYARLSPSVSIAKKRGGVTKGGQDGIGGLYVGSTLLLDCSKAAGYSVSPANGVYLTNSKGNTVAVGRPTATEGVWELTFLWDDMTEDDLADSYQINVIYERSQTLAIDIAPSVPREADGQNINVASIPYTWQEGFFGSGKTIKIEYGEAVPATPSEDDEIKDYTSFSSKVKELKISDFDKGDGKGIFRTLSDIKNLQAINFGQDEDDVILFNNHSYSGNEFIPLSSDDVASATLMFRFYDHDYLDAVSTMVASFDHAELYYDGDGGGISGSFVNGIFIPSEGDEYVGIIKGEHFEQEFAPFVDEEGNVHQYYIKAIYSLRPRAYKIPAGYNVNSKAQVFPVFLSAVTDPAESDKLTKEQKAYRYIDGENVDGHAMYGKEATALAYVDIPLGGDTSKVKRYSVTRGVYDTSGEKMIDSVNTTEYIWEPDYTGSLKVLFDNPEPIQNDDNITGKSVPYAGESPQLDSSGKYNYSKSGLDKINSYLGAFAGRSTFGICVQVQMKEYDAIGSLSDIAPESIEFANVSSVPNANSVLNFGSAENKDETQGQTPDGTGFNEFGTDIGMDLPSLEFGIGDYATLVMDGDQIGISIGLPLFKAESTSYGSDNTTKAADGSTVEQYKDDDGSTVKKTTKPDGGTETQTTSTTEDTQNHTKTVTTRTETVDKDGNKTYHNETTIYKTEEGKPDKPQTTTTDTNAPNTPPAPKTNGFKEANGQFGTLVDFIGSIAKQAGGAQGSVKEFMNGAFEDDSFKKAKNGQSTSRKMSFSLAVQIALTFEYNPVYNTHVFSSGALSATASFEFTLQYRFTPVPLVYVYVKTGISLEIGIGMGMEYKLVEADPITAFERGDFDSLTKRNGQMVFKLDDDYSGFHATFTGRMYMEVFDHMPKAGDEALTSGVISSSGGMSEILLTQYDDDLYISLTSVGDRVTMVSLRPITKSSKAYFNGAYITPSVSVEAGVGVGIELLKFELFVKTNLAITATFGEYIPDEERYEPAYMSQFNWDIAVGFNVVLLFANYSMDLVAFSVEGSQDKTDHYFTWVISATSANGMKELWTEIRYTDAHGKPIKDPTGGNHTNAIKEESAYKPLAEGEGLIRITGPTDITATQKLNAVMTSADELQRRTEDGSVGTNAIPASGTPDFELSGYGTSGDARVLAQGLTTGYSYKLFTALGENYIIYPKMIDGVPQIVMSKVIMVGDLTSGTGLQSPFSEASKEPYITLDGDGLADYDFSVGVEGSMVTATWTAQGANGTVTKKRSLDLEIKQFTEDPKVITEDDGMYRYLPDQIGNISVYAQSSSSEDAKKAAKADYKAYLVAKNPKLIGPDYDILEDGNTNDPILVSSVYSYITVSKLIDMQGTSTVLTAAVPGSEGFDLMTDTINGEVIENIETVNIDGRVIVAYTTSKTAYFDGEKGTTVSKDGMNETTERAVIRRLYLRQIGEDGFGSAKLIQEVADFEGCDSNNISTAFFKDGIYVQHALSKAEVDPHYANLRFVTAELELGAGAETFMLFEMGSNTYILRESGIISLADDLRVPVSITPVFENTQGTDVTIGSDGKKLAVVYTAAMPNSLSNAIWISWWDAEEGGWGETNVLAMRHLQIYEDSITYGMSPEDTELAYLGKLTTAGKNKGSMTRLSFGNLQMSTREVKDGEVSRQELMVLTEGSLTALEDFEFETVSGEKMSTVVPARRASTVYEGQTEEIPPMVGFYAIAFGEGKQGLGEASLGFANYDFTSGHELVGEVNFKNTGTAAIRAGASNPVTVVLSVSRPNEGSQELAKWLLTDSIPSGGKARLTFTTDPLTHDLPTGSTFSLYLTEDQDYFGKENAFKTTVPELFKIEEKAELAFGYFDAELRSIDGDYAVVYLDSSVLNVGNKDASEVFIQFTYDRGSEDENGVRYIPISLKGSDLTTGMPEVITRRGASTQSVEASEDNGVYLLRDEEGGKQIKKGYMRKVSGTIRVPVSAFIKGTDLSGLHLRAEIFSSDDDTGMVNNVYVSKHAEYNQSNNTALKTVKNATIFSTPSQVSLSLGNTLRLPVTYETTADKVDITVTEIDSGAQDWRSLLGILYYDSQTGSIVAAANETAQQMIEDGLVPTGIIQVKDTATNSIAAITFRITDTGDGVNIFKDDQSFTFYNRDGSETDLDAAESASSNEGWYFAYNVPADAWTGGEANEVPMNSDLSRAKQNGAYFTFLSTADTMDIYFTGKISVECDALEAPLSFTKSPAHVEFGNDTGLTYKIKVTADQGTDIDRYTATYKVSPVVLRDDDAPLILWNRSFPETASLKSGSEVPMRCYIIDNGGISKVQFDGIELSNKTVPAIEKVDDGMWYFDCVFTKNGKVEVVTYDTVGNTSKMIINVDWFNFVVSSGAIWDAPGLKPGDLYLSDDSGAPIPAGTIGYAPWLGSSYIPREDEVSDLYLLSNGEFTKAGFEKDDEAGRWKIVSNGCYMVKVDRDDGTWARVIMRINRLDISEPQLSVSVDGNVISFIASDDKEIASLTINGMPIEVSSNPFASTFAAPLGGKYLIEVKDDADHAASKTAEVSMDLVLPKDAVETNIKYDGKLIGTVSVDPSKVIGGEYDESCSKPEEGIYSAVYSFAVVNKDTDPASIDDSSFVSLAEGTGTVTDLPEGEYDIYLRDSKGHLTRYDESFHVYHPDDQWYAPEYNWAYDLSSVTASRKSKIYSNYIQSETAYTSSWVSRNATCEEKGETTYVAFFGNKVFKEQYYAVANIPALGHLWKEWEITKPAGDHEKGEETRVCARNATHIETREIPELGAPHYSFDKGIAYEWRPGDGSLEYAVIIDREEQRAFLSFKGVTVDGKDVDPADYTVDTKGSRLYLKEDYLKGLSRGEHSISILFEDGGISTTLTIVKTPIWIYWAGGIAIAALAAAFIWLFIKRRKKEAADQ